MRPWPADTEPRFLRFLLNRVSGCVGEGGVSSRLARSSLSRPSSFACSLGPAGPAHSSVRARAPSAAPRGGGRRRRPGTRRVAPALGSGLSGSSVRTPSGRRCVCESFRVQRSLRCSPRRLASAATAWDQARRGAARPCRFELQCCGMSHCSRFERPRASSLQHRIAEASRKPSLKLLGQTQRLCHGYGLCFHSETSDWQNRVGSWTRLRPLSVHQEG